jgi:hypothetical protein
MYTFRLKRSASDDVEQLLDTLIDNPLVILRNDKLARKLGIYAKSLRDEKILHISPDKKLNETVVFLKCNNYIKPKSIVKKKGKRIEYVFNDILVPNLEFKTKDLINIKTEGIR